MASIGDDRSTGSGKYELRVLNEGNCLEDSIFWPKDVSDVNVLFQSTARTCFKEATGTGKSSKIQSFESKGFIPLSFTVATNIKKGNIQCDCGESGTLVVFVQMVFHKEQQFVHCEDRNFFGGCKRILIAVMFHITWTQARMIFRAP